MLPGRPQCGRYPAAEFARNEPIGAGTHTGYGNLTLHATGDVGGLELRTRAGKAPALPGAFVVNIGDCLMRWTNDVYVSTPHRVVNRSGRERYSIAFFYDPNPDAEVAVIPTCVGAGESVRYPPVLAADGRLSEVPAGRQRAGYCRPNAWRGGVRRRIGA